jgi:hypothetical protein
VTGVSSADRPGAARAAELLRGLPERVERRPWPWLALLLVAIGIVWMWFGRHTTFKSDEWDTLYLRSSTGEWSGVDGLLRAHNEHLVLALVAYYRAMWATVGWGETWPYLLVNTAVHLAAVALLFVLFRERIGAIGALLVAGMFGVLHRGWDVVLWDFQFAFLLSVVCGIGALMAAERTGRRADVATGVLLGLSLAAAGWGLAFGASVILLMALRREWRRLVVPAIPLVIYAAWLAKYGKGDFSPTDLQYVPKFVGDAVTLLFMDLCGLPFRWGRVLMVAAFAGLAYWLWRNRRPTPLQVAAIALPFLAMAMTAVGRAPLGTAFTGWYGWPFAAMALVALAAMLPRRRRLGATATAALVVLAAGAAATNLDGLKAWSDGQSELTELRLARLGALEIVRPVLNPEFFGQLSWDAGHITPDRYFPATDRYGSPAYDEAEIKEQSAAVRAEADLVLFTEARPVLAPTGPPEGSCREVGPGTAKEPAEVPLPREGVVVAPSRASEVQIVYRRFADTWQRHRDTVVARTAVTPKRDLGSTPWTLGLVSERPVRICAPAL